MVQQTKRGSFWERNLHLEAGFNLSWGAVIAGVVTFLAVFLVFSLITSAIGFGMLSPTSRNPFEGVGTGVAVWTVITFIISLFCGGFVAGLAARKTGMLHGFLTWALSLLLVFIFLTSTAMSAVKVTGQAVGAVGSAVGSATGSVAGAAGDAISAGFSKVGDELTQVDTNALGEDTKQILRDTEVPELQPEYLEGLLTQTKDEILEGGKEIALHPENADEIVAKITDSIEQKINSVSTEVDRDAVKNAVAKNTDLTPEEADKAVDNAIEGVQKAQEEAKVQLENAKKAIADAQQSLEQTVQETRETAEDASNTVASASVILFVGLILGAIIASFAGILGSKHTRGTIVQE